MVEEAESQDAVYALAASPGFARDRICFAARASGLYRSMDGGDTWQPALDSLQLRSELPPTISAAARSASGGRPAESALASGEQPAGLLISAVTVSPDFASSQTVFAGSSNGILRSCDGGESWQITALPAPPTIVTCLAFSPAFAADGVAFAGTLEDGVYRSVNRGESWVRWNFGLYDLHVVALAVSPGFSLDETLYAGTDTGLYASKNGGRSWRPLPLPDELAPVLSIGLSSRHAQDGMLCAGTDSSGLWASADRGQSWRRTGADVMRESVNALVISPTQLLALAGEGLFCSRDGGGTWTSLAADALAEVEPSAVVAPEGLDAGALLLVGLADGRVLRLVA